MRAELVFTTGVGVLAAVGLAMAVGFGLIAGHIAVLFVLSCAIAYLIGRRVALPEERRWLPALLLWAMVAKLIGASFRYWLLFSIYGGTGDAVEYHRAGTQMAHMFRELSVPAVDTVPITGSFGTKLVAWITGLVYTPSSSPSWEAWLFSVLASSARCSVSGVQEHRRGPRWRRYALVVFWPTLLTGRRVSARKPSSSSSWASPPGGHPTSTGVSGSRGSSPWELRWRGSA